LRYDIEAALSKEFSRRRRQEVHGPELLLTRANHRDLDEPLADSARSEFGSDNHGSKESFAAIRLQAATPDGEFVRLGDEKPVETLSDPRFEEVTPCNKSEHRLQI
jgi:hypothetical protein